MLTITNISTHTGVSVKTYTLMHADELVAIAHKDSGLIDIRIPEKLPFGIRSEQLDFLQFMDWMRKRVDNLQRSYMNKVYLARKVGRELDNILRDSCALSITDQFWINRSDIDMTWIKLQELRDKNEALNDVALTGNTANMNWDAVMKGITSLFTTKGAFSKAIYRDHMLKCGGTQEREWVAFVIGKLLGLPVQEVLIKNPSLSEMRKNDGSSRDPLWKEFESLASENELVLRSIENASINELKRLRNIDDTLVEIVLFTSKDISLVHASELFANSNFGEAHRDGQHHRYFYDRLPNETFKREFERVLMLNWLISNHDMHGENFGCLYSPKTFKLIGVAPSFDHNSADFDGTIPELDVPDIIKNSIQYHGDIVSKIESGLLETALEEVMEWLTQEQKNCVRSVGVELVNLYKSAI